MPSHVRRGIYSGCFLPPKVPEPTNVHHDHFLHHPFRGRACHVLTTKRTQEQVDQMGNVRHNCSFLLSAVPRMELGYVAILNCAHIQCANRLPLVTSNVAGGTKRTVVSSLTLVAYCVGNMVGAQVFKTKDAPRYIGGTIACSACFGLEVFVIICWRLWYMYENKRRDRLAAESSMSKEEQEQHGRELGEQDVTDRQNPYFRYSM